MAVVCRACRRPVMRTLSQTCTELREDEVRRTSEPKGRELCPGNVLHLKEVRCLENEPRSILQLQHYSDAPSCSDNDIFFHLKIITDLSPPNSDAGASHFYTLLLKNNRHCYQYLLTD